jgi:hypothetical protein
MGVLADPLKTTLDTWNSAVKNKKDAEFDRTTAMENDLSRAPYLYNQNRSRDCSQQEKLLEDCTVKTGSAITPLRRSLIS